MTTAAAAAAAKGTSVSIPKAYSVKPESYAVLVSHVQLDEL